MMPRPVVTVTRVRLPVFGSCWASMSLEPRHLLLLGDTCGERLADARDEIGRRVVQLGERAGGCLGSAPIELEAHDGLDRATQPEACGLVVGRLLQRLPEAESALREQVIELIVERVRRVIGLDERLHVLETTARLRRDGERPAMAQVPLESQSQLLRRREALRGLAPHRMLRDLGELARDAVVVDERRQQDRPDDLLEGPGVRRRLR